MISAAAAKRSMAASPRVIKPPKPRFPLKSSAAASVLVVRRPAPAVTAPAALSPLLRNERRLIAFILLHMFCIKPSCSNELELAQREPVSRKGKKMVVTLLCCGESSLSSAKFDQESV